MQLYIIGYTAFFELPCWQRTKAIVLNTYFKSYGLCSTRSNEIFQLHFRLEIYRQSILSFLGQSLLMKIFKLIPRVLIIETIIIRSRIFATMVNHYAKLTNISDWKTIYYLGVFNERDSIIVIDLNRRILNTLRQRILHSLHSFYFLSSSRVLQLEVYKKFSNSK